MEWADGIDTEGNGQAKRRTSGGDKPEPFGVQGSDRFGAQGSAFSGSPSQRSGVFEGSQSLRVLSETEENVEVAFRKWRPAFWAAAESLSIMVMQFAAMLPLMHVVDHHEMNVTGRCHSEKPDWSALRTFCTVAGAHTRNMPSMIALASLSRVGYLFLHKFLYHKMLNNEIMIIFGNYWANIMHDPFVWCLAMHFFFVWAHFTLVCVFERDSIDVFGYFSLFLAPVFTQVVHYNRTFRVRGQMVTLIEYASKPLAHARMGRTIPVTEDILQEIMRGVLRELDQESSVCTIADVCERIKKALRTNTCRARKETKCSLTWIWRQISMTWWPRYLLLHPVLYDKDIVEFRVYWRFFVWVGITINSAVLYFTFKREASWMIGIILGIYKGSIAVSILLVYQILPVCQAWSLFKSQWNCWKTVKKDTKLENAIEMQRQFIETEEEKEKSRQKKKKRDDWEDGDW